MTEAEWLACDDPTRMLEFARAKASARKLRSLVVACARPLKYHLPEASRDAMEVFERYADVHASRSEYARAFNAAEAEALAADRDPPDVQTYATASLGLSLIPTVASACSCLEVAAPALATAMAHHAFSFDAAYNAEFDRVRHTQSRTIRDVFSGPKHLAPLHPSWLTSTVIALSQGIYADRAFGRMPIVADALQDAGCDNDDILTHCRSDEPHVRSCWVIDLLLGKA